MSSVDVQCGCGSLEVRLTGEPVAQFYCHCDDCQVVHGAAYVPVAMYRRACVEVVAGAPLVWRYKVTARVLCPTCGSRVFAEPPGMGVCGVTAGLLPAGAFRPMFHIQCQHARLPVVDDLPHYRSFPPMFGGPDETVDW